jgi:hypothetical protein
MASSAAATPETGNSFAAEAAAVRALLAKGSAKPAVELAKQIHKRYAAQESEALLVEAYEARIGSLLERQMEVEAKALMDLVCERFPAARPRFEDLRAATAIRCGDLQGLLAPLADSNLPADRRTAIEERIKREVTDLAAIADCAALPAGHPLRTGAAALRQALEAVTTREVSDEEIQLAEIARRGPLANWKTLIRAIALFYRGDDAACRRHVEALEPEAAAARLGRVLLGMLDRAKPEGAAAESLVRQLGGGVAELRAAFARVDEAFAGRRVDRVVNAVRSAVNLCREVEPQLLEPFRNHVAARAMLADLNPDGMLGAMGRPRTTAAHSRMLALASERADETGWISCTFWELFRCQALEEGWFRKGSPEEGAVYLHMALLLSRMPYRDFHQMREEIESESEWLGPPANHIDPSRLFAEACRCDPHREAFERWYAWEEQSGEVKRVEEVAESWHRALPEDAMPLLKLMEAAEKRGALSKALGYLKRAEEIDTVNPSVRHGRWRLSVAIAFRHLQGRNARLLLRDTVQLAQLPQAQDKDRPALVAALRRGALLMQGDLVQAAPLLAQIAELLDDRLAAGMLGVAVANLAGIHDGEASDASHAPREPGALVTVTARVCAIADDAGWGLTVMPDQETALLADLQAGAARIPVAGLASLAEAALRQDNVRLAYAVTVTGLARGGSCEARFLYLRARSLPHWQLERGGDCLAAAIELARRQQDQQLVHEAVEWQRFDALWGLPSEVVSLTAEQLRSILERERKATRYPEEPVRRQRKGFNWRRPWKGWL